MNRVPCEHIVWNLLPIIRKEIAVCMINNFGLSQKEAAEKLGISPAAVSQYLSGKRGNFNFTNKMIGREFNKSAEKIIQNGEEILVSETCRICNIFLSKNLFPFDRKS
jgi:predicted transcriptional regulator